MTAQELGESAANDMGRLIQMFEFCHIAFFTIAILLVIYISYMVSIKNNMVTLWRHYIQDFLLWGIADKQIHLEDGKSVEGYIKERFDYYNKSALPDELHIIQDKLSGGDQSCQH